MNIYSNKFTFLILPLLSMMLISFITLSYNCIIIILKPLCICVCVWQFKKKLRIKLITGETLCTMCYDYESIMNETNDNLTNECI